MKKENNLKKNFIWNVIGSTFASFISLFLMIIVTRVNGTTQAGIFTFGFSTACLFYIIGIYAGRVFQITYADEKVNDSDYFYFKIISCISMIILAIIFCLVRSYINTKILIIVLLVVFKAIEAFSESIYAVIQRNDELYKVGVSLFIKAIISIILFLILDLIFNSLIISILSMIIVNILIIIFYDIKNIKLTNFKLEKSNRKRIIYIFKIGFCTFAFAFLTQYIINAPRYAIDSQLSSDLQTIFGIIVMPATVIALLGQFVIHPFLLKLQESLKIEKKNFFKLTSKLAFMILIVGVLIFIIAYYLGIPVLQILYNIELGDYLNCLLIIISGAILYGISIVLSTSLTIMKSTFSQLVIFSVSSVYAFFASQYFVANYQVLGASLTYFSTMLILLILYVFTYLLILKKYEVNKK